MLKQRIATPYIFSHDIPVPSNVAMMWNPKALARLKLRDAASLNASDVVLNLASRTPDGAFRKHETMAAAAAADDAERSNRRVSLCHFNILIFEVFRHCDT